MREGTKPEGTLPFTWSRLGSSKCIVCSKLDLPWFTDFPNSNITFIHQIEYEPDTFSEMSSITSTYPHLLFNPCRPDLVSDNIRQDMNGAEKTLNHPSDQNYRCLKFIVLYRRPSELLEFCISSHDNPAWYTNYHVPKHTLLSILNFSLQKQNCC